MRSTQQQRRHNNSSMRDGYSGNGGSNSARARMRAARIARREMIVKNAIQAASPCIAISSMIIIFHLLWTSQLHLICYLRGPHDVKCRSLPEIKAARKAKIRQQLDNIRINKEKEQQNLIEDRQFFKQLLLQQKELEEAQEKETEKKSDETVNTNNNNNNNNNNNEKQNNNNDNIQQEKEKQSNLTENEVVIDVPDAASSSNTNYQPKENDLQYTEQKGTVTMDNNKGDQLNEKIEEVRDDQQQKHNNNNLRAQQKSSTKGR